MKRLAMIAKLPNGSARCSVMTIPSAPGTQLLALDTEPTNALGNCSTLYLASSSEILGVICINNIIFWINCLFSMT